MASEIQNPLLIRDNVPGYIHNKHTTYENTMLNVFTAIVGSLKDTPSADALLADQGRLFIGGLMKHESERFIKEKYQSYYDEIYPTIKANTTDNQKRIATVQTWERLINEAFAKFINDHHVDHTKAKIAVLDIDPEKGKQFTEISDVDYIPLEDFNRPGYLLNHEHAYPAWSYAQYVAKMVTGPKNIDRKIFIVGDSGDGKSMTGLCLALRISAWIAYYENVKLVKQNKIANAKAEDYFKFDDDHIACINTDDLIHVATVELPQYSIKMLDDCGAAVGFTNRRAMTNDNLDMVSIIGTNRVRNGVTIYCVQTEDFTDVRMRMLANEKIDLTDYTESNGKYRIAKLFKIKRAKGHKNKIIECNFAFWSHGKHGGKFKSREYCTIEGIICFMPDDQAVVDKYNELRIRKEADNTRAIKEKYKNIQTEQEIKDEMPRCKYCNSSQLEYRTNGIKCNKCKRYQ
jgi:hypothetical protein